MFWHPDQLSGFINYQRTGPNLSEKIIEINCEDEAQYDITQYKPKQEEVQS